MIGRVLLYTVLIAMALFTLIPFVWMLSSSLKLDQEVFQYPIRWIPETFHWENYRVIWERVSLMTYFKNTAIIALTVTFLQTLTSSFAAYAFAKLHFKGRDLLFVAYIATIAVPWQAYMLPQFIMMRSMGLYDTLWAMIVLQAFSAFGVFLMRQFYQGIPTELCEAARIDGLSEYGIWAKIMLPLSTAAIATLVIFTFVGTWNDYMGPMIPPYHGGVAGVAAAGVGGVPLLAEILHRGHCNERPEGIKWKWKQRQHLICAVLPQIPAKTKGQTGGNSLSALYQKGWEKEWKNTRKPCGRQPTSSAGAQNWRRTRASSRIRAKKVLGLHPPTTATAGGQAASGRG